MKTKVALHRFESDPNIKQRDGVNLAHTEINRLLEDTPAKLLVEFHDFDRLLRDKQYAYQMLKDTDCVLCNVGPHGHYYFYLRETMGLDFRIVRDIKTALWSSYLLQESLCQPYLRPGDVLLATSNYSRVLTRHLFPHLNDHPIYLFEPVLVSMEDNRITSAKAINEEGIITLGYIGRLSEDKNFPEVVDLLLALHREEPGRYRLMACGAVHSPGCAPNLIAQRVHAETGRHDLFVYIPPVAHDQVLPILRQFDYFLFFSTSNLEVLGRVLIEATYAGVPILAANHAAAAELLAPSSLIDVTYKQNQSFYSHFDTPLGTVDIEMAAILIRGHNIPDAPPPPRVNKSDILVNALLDQGEPTDPTLEYLELSTDQQNFLNSLHCEDLPNIKSQTHANRMIEELLEWFSALNGKRGQDFASRLKELERRSRFKERTRRLMATVEHIRGDFTNLGGIDIELCNIVGYHPKFTLMTESQRLLPLQRDAPHRA
jgi:glycosyltransferase involved in cell wall biosynthesis